MKKIIGIHQPMFLPYTGVIKKIIDSDIFVFLDDVQFADSGFQNRNRMLTKDGVKWLTVPLKKPRYMKKINELMINYDTKWVDTMLSQIQHSYGKAPFCKEVLEVLENSLNKKYELLSELNINLTKDIIKYFNIDKEYKISSDIGGKPDDKIDRIIYIVKNQNGDIFLSGDGAKDYIEIDRFTDVEVKFQNYVCQEYNQMGEKAFVPYLSILDYMMINGNNTSKL